MTNSKFSKQLQTTKRKWLTELRESDAGCGAWNADATTSDRPMGDFEEVVNLRKMKPGELEVRSGVRQWLPSKPQNQIFGIPLWKAEYRMDSVFVDVTFFLQKGDDDSGEVWAFILHPNIPPPNGTQPQRTDPTCGIFVRICKAQDVTHYSLTDYVPIVCAYQYQTWLMVSVITTDPLITDPNDTTVWVMQPDDLTLLHWTATPRLVGKEITPTPTGFTFSPTATGKLYVFQRSQDFAGTDTIRYAFDAKTGEALTTGIDIKAPYFLAGDTSSNVAPWVLETPVVSLWTRNKIDTPTAEPIQSTKHIKSRGWWYRPVLKRKLTDVRGQDHIISEAPGVDFYVEERIYAPPFLAYSNSDGGAHFPAEIGLIGADYAGARIKKSDGTIITIDPSQHSWPSVSALTTLRSKWRDTIPSSAIDNFSDPFYLAAVALGGYGATAAAAVYNTLLADGYPPYKLDVGAHLVNGSPNVIFTWANFGLEPTQDTTLYSIDFYRTAYSYPDEKDNATKSPLWGTPYNYGYAGTLHVSDTRFTDTIADTALLFDQSPIDAEGYLTGQFAGEVMRPYQDRLVMGNIRTKYQITTPWGGLQAFAYLVPDVQAGYPIGAINNNRGDSNYATGDGQYTVAFYYAYLDRDGNQSDFTAILPDREFEHTPDHEVQNLVFNFPRGYSDAIVSALLIRSVWTWTNPADHTQGGVRTYYRETTVPLSTGTYFSTGPATGQGLNYEGGNILPSLGTTLPSHTLKESTDPGSIIWSKINNGWEWPQENIEQETDQNPITALDEVIGPLYVFSDRSIVMTRLDGYREPVQTSSITSGCISRYACVKIDQVVFTMTANGLIFTGGSGVVPFGANIQTEIQKRLREQITTPAAIGGVTQVPPALYGVRNRVSMSYLAQRGEIWIHFPSTIELGGQFPARTFILKFFDQEKSSYGHANYFQHASSLAYEFEIAKPNPVGPVLFLPHLDGTLFCSYQKNASGDLIVQNNDDPNYVWPGEWAFEYQHSMGTPNVAKIFFQLNFLAEMTSRVYLKTGMGREDGKYDRLNGTLSPATAIREIVQQNNGISSEYRLPISGSILETSGTPPGFRLYGKPNDLGENWFKIESFDLFFGYLAQHKGD